MTTRHYLVAIVLLAAALRFYGLWFGLPYAHARPDETTALGLATSVRGGDLNPRFFHWPSLTIYVFAALHAAVAAIRRAFALDPALGFTEQVLLARGAVALAGTLTVVVLFTLARRMGGPAVGLLAALYLAVAILHVRESHFAMTDVLMVLLLTTSLGLLLRALDERIPAGTGERAFWRFAAAGLAGGLATSTKYNAGAVLAAMGAAQIYWLVRFRPRIWTARAWLPSAGFLAAFVAGFLAGTPYALLDYERFGADLYFDLTHLSDGHGTNLGRGWEYHALRSLPYGLGVPVFVAALAGIVPTARHFPRQALVLGAFAVSFYAAIGSGQTVFFRYVLPLVPILCVSAAVATERAALWLAARPGVGPRLASVVLTVLIAGPALVNSVWFDVVLSRTDSRVLAARWLAPRLRANDSVYDSGGDYTRLHLGRVDYDVRVFDPAANSFAHPEGRTPDWLVLHESPMSMYTSVPYTVLELAATRYHLLMTVPGTSKRAGAAVYDLQDAFFMPVSGFRAIRRPGPTVRIYRRHDASTAALPAVHTRGPTP
jgi:hypothetical protein